MKVFLTINADAEKVYIQAMADGDGAIGDMTREVGPDDTFLGWSYDELVKLGDGEQDLEPKDEKQS